MFQTYSLGTTVYATSPARGIGEVASGAMAGRPRGIVTQDFRPELGCEIVERIRMGWVEKGRRRYSGAGIRAIVHIRAQLAAADGEAAPGKCARHRAQRDGLTRIFSVKGCEASKVIGKLVHILHCLKSSSNKKINCS